MCSQSVLTYSVHLMHCWYHGLDSIAVPAFAVWLNTKQGALSTQKGLPLYDIYLIVNLII